MMRHSCGVPPLICTRENRMTDKLIALIDGSIYSKA